MKKIMNSEVITMNNFFTKNINYGLDKPGTTVKDSPKEWMENILNYKKDESYKDLLKIEKIKHNCKKCGNKLPPNYVGLCPSCLKKK